jgi:ABC-type multidrug transport system fused ATPase/permease subunit
MGISYQEDENLQASLLEGGNHDSDSTKSLPTSINDEDISKDEESSKIKEYQHSSLYRILLWGKNEWPTAIIAMLALVISTIASLAQPYFFGLIINVGTSNERRIREKVSSYALLLSVILVFGGIFSIIRAWLFGLIGERIVKNIRSHLFEKMARLDISFFDTNSTGELVSRLTSDTAAIQSCLSVNVSIGLRSLAQVVFSIIILFLTSWKLTLILVGVVPILLIGIKGIERVIVTVRVTLLLGLIKLALGSGLPYI